MEVKIGTHKVAAVLDTGARPSVIDIGTARRLELMDRLVAAPSRVYGPWLGSIPVQFPFAVF